MCYEKTNITESSPFVFRNKDMHDKKKPRVILTKVEKPFGISQAAIFCWSNKVEL